MLLMIQYSEKLELAKTAVQEQLDVSHCTLDDLDELRDIMSDMLQKQQDIEVCPLAVYFVIHDSICYPGRVRGSLGNPSAAIFSHRGSAPQIRPISVTV